MRRAIWVVMALAAPAGAQSAKAVFAGGQASCAIMDDSGTLRCWGGNYGKQLGPRATTEDTPVATEVPGVAAKTVAIGGSHVCALTHAGKLVCWGSGSRGQLGDGRKQDSVTPVEVALPGVIDVAARNDSTCARDQSGAVLCWGMRLLDKPLEVPAFKGALAVVLGDRHGCALLKGGAVRCAGENRRGQLGDGSSKESRTGVTVKGLGKASALAAGAEFTCAIVSGAVWCWGLGDHAQLGDPDLASSTRPRKIPALTDAVELALGVDHACARRAAGGVVCWGASDRSSFGYPDGCPDKMVGTIMQPGVAMSLCAQPMPVAGTEQAVHVVHADLHACVIDGAGKVRCWGGNGRGVLGKAAPFSEKPVDMDFSTPAAARGLAARSIVLGGATSCAVLGSGELSCWGRQFWGDRPLYDQERRPEPRAVPGLGAVTAAAVGNFHTCALSGGSVMCFGYNDHGALGDGTSEKRAQPVVVKDVTGIKQVSCSSGSFGNHTCAIDGSGRVSCWGQNDHGQVTPRRKETNLVGATPVVGAPRAIKVVAGDGASCALDKAGKVTCWGGNPEGALGMPTGERIGPRVIAGLDGVRDFGLGSGNGCALRKDGSVWCWGDKESKVAPPAAVAGLPRARLLAMTSYSAQIVGDDGTLWKWSTRQAGKPRQLGTVKDVAELACGGAHCCVRDGAGAVWCWGANESGQLGDPAAGAGGAREEPGRVGL